MRVGDIGFREISVRRELQEIPAAVLRGKDLRIPARPVQRHVRSQAALTGITRDDAKNICFTAFFSNYQHREVATPIADTEHRLAELLRYGADDAQIDAVLDTLFKKRSYALFKQEFPAVHALFSEIKALSWDFNSGEPHSNNCLLAQRIESGIIYTCFVKALVKAGITRFYTVHDAIRVKQQDEPKALTVIEKEIQKLGLNLKLK